MKVMRMASYIPILICLSCNSPKSNNDNSVIDQKIAIKNSTTSIIYRSTDNGNSWNSYANGIPLEATVSSFVYFNNSVYATTDVHGIYAIKEGEDRWTRMDVDLPEKVDVNAIISANGTLFIGTFRHGIFFSTDGGHNWRQSLDKLAHTPIRSLLFYKDMLLVGTDNGIYITSDNGNTWRQTFKNIQTNGFATQGDKIYAALMNGAVMSDDAGANWKYIYQPLTLHDISSDDEFVYAMTLGDGLLKSNNDGVLWRNINGGFGPTRFYTFEVKRVEEKLIAGQWFGIYSSKDGGTSWKVIKNGLPDSTAFCTLEVTPLGILAGIGLRKK